VPSYSGGRHPPAIAEQLPLPIGIDTNTGWPFINSVVASSYSNFSVGDPVGCNRSLNHFVDLYTHRQLALCNRRTGVRCQHYWPINQSDFRPMKFHMQSASYSISDLPPPAFFKFSFQEWEEGLGLKIYLYALMFTPPCPLLTCPSLLPAPLPPPSVSTERHSTFQKGNIRLFWRRDRSTSWTWLKTLRPRSLSKVMRCP